EVIDRGAALRIVARDDVAGRLVEGDPDRLGGGDGASVDLDLVPLRVYPGAELRDGLAVDRNAAGTDQLLGGAARGDSGLGEELLETYRFGHGSAGCGGRFGCGAGDLRCRSRALAGGFSSVGGLPVPLLQDDREF